MGIEVKLVKAFTKDKNQGNPAGVILKADNLTDKKMIQVTNELGFSESVFIQRSDKADYKFRFFSPKQEVGLCGHATIAGFHVVTKNSPKMYTMETKEGIFPIACYEEGLIFMQQKNPEFFNYKSDRGEVSTLLGISKSDLLDYPLQIVSTGTPKLIIPIVSLDVLFKIKPNLKGIEEYCKRTGARGFYPFTFETKDNSDFHARQFNPFAGIDEDPITGVAAGALVTYIVRNKLSDKTKFIIEQGYIMNKSGKIFVDVSNGVKVGGYAVIFGKKVLK